MSVYEDDRVRRTCEELLHVLVGNEEKAKFLRPGVLQSLRRLVKDLRDAEPDDDWELTEQERVAFRTWWAERLGMLDG